MSWEKFLSEIFKVLSGINVNEVLAAIITAIITGLIGLFGRKEKEKKDNIIISNSKIESAGTIRDMVTKLNGASYIDTIKLIPELKMMISAYGLNKKDYLHHFHIWRVIRDIESMASDDQKLLEKKQKELTDYLLLILQYQGDKTKNIRKSYILYSISWIFFSMGALYFFETIPLFDYTANKGVSNHDYFSIILCYIIINIILLPLFFSIANDCTDWVISYIRSFGKYIRKNGGSDNVYVYSIGAHVCMFTIKLLIMIVFWASLCGVTYALYECFLDKSNDIVLSLFVSGILYLFGFLIQFGVNEYEANMKLCYVEAIMATEYNYGRVPSPLQPCCICKRTLCENNLLKK